MIGRAGRAGEKAHALLLWTGADPKKRYFHFESAYPPVETLSLYLSDLGRIFPTPPSTRLVSDAQIASHIRISSEKIPQKLPGLMTALRLLGALEMPRGNSAYVTIRMANNRSAQELLMELPDTPTRRSRLISWLCNHGGEGWRTLMGASTLQPWDVLTDAVNMSRPQCEEILNWYTARADLEWTTVSPELARTQWILKGSEDSARSNMKLYAKLRRDFHDSLAELERLANQNHCRLQRAHDFFGDESSKPSRRCGQCDLCLSFG